MLLSKQGNAAELRLVWLAAMIDAEGHITMIQSYKAGTIQPVVGMSNSSASILKAYKLYIKQLGIKIGKGYSFYPNKKSRLVTNLNTSKSCDVLKLLKNILPYLIAKKDQAKLLIEFIESRILCLKEANKARYTLRQRNIYRLLRKLNQRGVMNVI